MKILRKTIILNLFLLTICFAFSFNIKAARVYDDEGKAYYEEKTILEQEQLSSYTTWRHIYGETGANKQYINLFEQQCEDDVKVVSWAVKNGNAGFSLATLMDVAEDYETKHPGWKVLCGINADQYAQSFGNNTATGSDYFWPQPYYPMIADGENWFARAWNGASGNVVGFLNDGSNDQLLDKSRAISGLYLTVYNNKGEVVEKIELKGINIEPSDGETTLYSPYYTNNGGRSVVPVNALGTNIYVVGNADSAWLSNLPEYSSWKGGFADWNFYGKGAISAINNNTITLNQMGSFALSTKNTELINLLAMNTYIECQFEFSTDLNNVESAVGYHSIMRYDNIDQNAKSDYNLMTYPRSIFGRKADGTVVLMTIDKAGNADGAGTDEMEAILKSYGVVEAYQMDGGGSVTAMVRRGNEFILVNTPTSTPRKILSVLLFVVPEEQTVRINNLNENEYFRVGDDINVSLDIAGRHTTGVKYNVYNSNNVQVYETTNNDKGILVEQIINTSKFDAGKYTIKATVDYDIGTSEVAAVVVNIWDNAVDLLMIYSSPIVIKKDNIGEITFSANSRKAISSFDYQFTYDSSALKIESIEKTDSLIGTFDYNIETPGIVNIKYTNTVQLNQMTDLFKLSVKVLRNNEAKYSFEIDNTYSNIFKTSSNTNIENVFYNFGNIHTKFMGDIDDNDIIDIGDLILTKLIMAKKVDSNSINGVWADLNDDGNVNDEDIKIFEDYLIGEEKYLYRNVYTVKFTDKAGNVISTQVIYEGENAISPRNLYIAGFDFICWSYDYDNVLQDLILNPIYKAK